MGVLADHRAANDTGGLTYTADLVTHGAADQTTDERTAGMTAGLELPDGEDLVVDASRCQGLLHERDHLRL